jgi:hypothetical protein
MAQPWLWVFMPLTEIKQIQSKLPSRLFIILAFDRENRIVVWMMFVGKKFKVNHKNRPEYLRIFRGRRNVQRKKPSFYFPVKEVLWSWKQVFYRVLKLSTYLGTLSRHWPFLLVHFLVSYLEPVLNVGMTWKFLFRMAAVTTEPAQFQCKFPSHKWSLS